MITFFGSGLPRHMFEVNVTTQLKYLTAANCFVSFLGYHLWPRHPGLSRQEVGER